MQHIFTPGGTYFITTVTAGRHKEFWHQEEKIWKPTLANCDAVIRNLDFYRMKHSFQLHGYVIMPDHVHLLLTTSVTGMLAAVMRDLKHRIATEIHALSGNRGAFWQADYYEHGIRNDKDFREKLAYIHDNPVRARLVNDPLAAWYSSAHAWEAGEHKPLRVDFID